MIQIFENFENKTTKQNKTKQKQNKTQKQFLKKWI